MAFSTVRPRIAGYGAVSGPRIGVSSASRLSRRRAFKEVGDISTKDWRTQRMAEAVERLYDRVWNQGDLELISQLVSDGVVVREAIWAAERPLVGRRAFQGYVEALREAYPDICYELQSIGVADANHLFVYWFCHGTNLRPIQNHRPSYHESHVSGIDLVSFNEDRSSITEIITFRQGTFEEKELAEEEALARDRLVIKLNRLV